MNELIVHGGGADAVRRLRGAFDNVWTLATLMAAALLVVGWYFGLARFDIERVVWILAVLAAAQLIVSSQTRALTAVSSIQHVVLGSQLLGTVALVAVWHLAGGLQQPLFPLLILVPLLPAFLVLNLWQRLVACGVLLLGLLSGVLLAPGAANSFLEDRYGLHLAFAAVPAWLPRSHVAFVDVSTTAPYDVMLLVSMAVITLAIGATAGVVAGLGAQLSVRAGLLGREVERLEALNTQLLVRAPSADILVSSGTGRIVTASERFAQEFGWAANSGSFLLDTVRFRYPDTVKRLLNEGGEDIQIVNIHGREFLVRVRAAVVGQPGNQVTRLCFERCDELAWRGEVDAVDEPIFAINSGGQVLFPNRAAVALFGASVEGRAAQALFDGSAEHWWDISPLPSARRVVRRGTERFVASIRRERIASSVGEMAIVRLSVNKGLQAA